MPYTKTFLIGNFIAAGIFLSACTSSSVEHENDYIYQGMNFGPDRDIDFKKGVRDACHTADGDYTKDHQMFKNNINYRVGWEDGRIHCKGEGDEVAK